MIHSALNITQSDLQAGLTENIAQNNVAGASVAILRGGEVVTACAGVTNVTTDVKITPETVMHVGSITKIFTATLVMQLVDEGIVDLEERVVTYLPDLALADREALNALTVKMLLNHTSGIDGDWLPDYGHDQSTIEDGIAWISERGQLFRPGTEFSYSNSAYVIAGFLVQRLRGKSWYDVVKERIFEPLRMEHAATLPEEALLHRASVGHHLDPVNQKLVRTSFAFLSLSFAPAGSTLMMSARDLVTFARAHIADGVGENGTRILSSKSTKAMQLTTVNNKGKGYSYGDGLGLGWMLADDGMLFHAGGGPGIIAALYVYPQQQFAAAILTNAAHGLSTINTLMEPLLKEVGSMKPFGLSDVHLPPEPVKVEPKDYVGVYEDVLNRFYVSQTPDGLTLSRQAKLVLYDGTPGEATPAVPLVPLGNERFLLEPNNEIFTFRRPDAQGQRQYLGTMMRLNKRLT